MSLQTDSYVSVLGSFYVDSFNLMLPTKEGRRLDQKDGWVHVVIAC